MLSEAEAAESVNGESNGIVVSHSSGSSQTSPTAPTCAEQRRSIGNRRIGWGFVWGIGTGIAAGAIATFALLSDNSQSSRDAEANVQASAVASQNQTSSAVAVTTALAQTTKVSQTLEATGTVQAREMLPIYPKATGLQIQQVLVDEGDRVQAGDVMVRLDNAVLRSRLEKARADLAQARSELEELQAGTRPEEIAQATADVRRYEAQVESAKSSLELAKARVERNRKLANEGAIASDRLDEILTTASNRRAELAQAQAQLSRARERLEQLRNGPRREQIAQAQARVQSARATVNQLETELEQTIVRAPAAGVVAERMAKVGDVTGSNKQLFSLMENGLLELQVKVPETQLSQVEVGQTATITSDARKDLQLQGRIHEIAPLIDNESRQATVKIHLPSRPGLAASDVKPLRPGMFLRAEMATTTTSSVVVPAKAVLPQSDGKNMVFKLQPDNTVQAVSVEVGELLSGSAASTQLSTSHQANGSSVRKTSNAPQLAAGEPRVEIQSGLQPGDRVVVEGAPYLADGDRVNPITK